MLFITEDQRFFSQLYFSNFERTHILLLILSLIL